MNPQAGNRGDAEIIGHRGYPARFPENTLPSLEGALEAGCRFLEWDLHVTADGVPVLFHDDTLERTTDGEGPLRERTLAELKELDAGSWFDPRFRDTPIPTLEEALRGPGRRTEGIYPEVKRVNDPGDLKKILDQIRAADLLDRTVLISLNFGLLEGFRKLEPGVRLGWVVGREQDMDGAIRAVAEDGLGVLIPDYRFLLENRERTRDLVTRGVELGTWTVDDPGDAEALMELGVRRITTNQAGELLRWAAGR
jgi:glycerophosphoryl diester phosphodiesterase